MAITVINPNIGTSNPGHFDRAVMALITTSQSDPGALYDVVVATVTLAVDVLFTLPQARKFPGKQYVMVVAAINSNALVVTPFAGDTVDGAASFSMPGPVPQTYTIVSNGGTNWIVTQDSSTIPAATGSVRGGVYLLAGGDTQSHSGTAPKMVNSMIDTTAVPPATVSNRGGVALAGTPSDPLEPVVPVVETDVFQGTLTTGSLVGKTVTIVNGLIVSIA